jgi:hypothetical protein
VMGVIESLIGEGEAAQNNQENSNPDDRFHKFLNFPDDLC